VTELRNGSIHLSVGLRAGSKDKITNELTFSPIEEKLEIACSSRNAVPENFTVDNFNQPTVERKIKEFLSAVLA
jgi:hypothetical protein